MCITNIKIIKTPNNVFNVIAGKTAPQFKKFGITIIADTYNLSCRVRQIWSFGILTFLLCIPTNFN